MSLTTASIFFQDRYVTGTIILPENVSAVSPGDSLTVKVDLVDKIPLNIGLKFVMREGNITIGAVL